METYLRIHRGISLRETLRTSLSHKRLCALKRCLFNFRTLLSPTVIGIGIACCIAALLGCLSCLSLGTTDCQKTCGRVCCAYIGRADTTAQALQGNDAELNDVLLRVLEIHHEDDKAKCRRSVCTFGCIGLTFVLLGTCYWYVWFGRVHDSVDVRPKITVFADIEHGLRYIGAQCNTISGAGCNPAQLPMATAIPSAFATSLLLQLNASDLAVDVTSYTESESSVRVDKTASSASQDSSDSFGIKGETSLHAPASSSHSTCSESYAVLDVCSAEQ